MHINDCNDGCNVYRESGGVENTVRFRRGERVRWKVDSRVEYKVILARENRAGK